MGYGLMSQALGMGIQIFPEHIKQYGLDAAMMYAHVWEYMGAVISRIERSDPRIRHAIMKNDKWLPLNTRALEELGFSTIWVEQQLTVLQLHGRLLWRKCEATDGEFRRYEIILLKSRFEDTYDVAELEESEIGFYTREFGEMEEGENE